MAQLLCHKTAFSNKEPKAALTHVWLWPQSSRGHKSEGLRTSCLCGVGPVWGRPEGPRLLASAFHLWLHFTHTVLHRQLWGGPGHNAEKRKSSDNQGLRNIHLGCYCYVLHKRQMSLCNLLFFIAIVSRCLWDQNKSLQGPSL